MADDDVVAGGVHTVVGGDHDRVRLNVPPHWQRVEAPGADLALSAPDPGGGRFRANVVVTVAAIRDETIADLSSLAMATALATNPGCRLLACDVWPHHEMGDGRRIEFAYVAPDTVVQVSQWIFAGDSREVVLTASRAVEDVLPLDAVFEYVLAGLAVIR